LVNEGFLNYARSLDKYYLPTRYPNGFESGSPYEYFTKKEADDKPFIDRIPEWSEKIKINFPVEIFPYTEKEINNPIVQAAVKRGMVLFER